MRFSDQDFQVLLDDILDAAHDGLADHLRQALSLARENVFVALISAGVAPASSCEGEALPAAVA